MDKFFNKDIFIWPYLFDIQAHLLCLTLSPGLAMRRALSPPGRWALIQNGESESRATACSARLRLSIGTPGDNLSAFASLRCNYPSDFSYKKVVLCKFCIHITRSAEILTQDCDRTVCEYTANTLSESHLA